MTGPAAARRPFTCVRTDGFFGSSCVQMTGELDLAGSPTVDAMVRQAQLDARLVMLDLRELTFMDCAGLHVIVDAAIRARREAERLVVARGKPQVDMVFQLVGSSRWLEMIDLEATEPAVEALQRLARQSSGPRAPRLFRGVPVRGRSVPHSAHRLGSA